MASNPTSYLSFAGDDEEERRRQQLLAMLDQRGGFAPSTANAQAPVVQPDPEPPVPEPERPTPAADIPQAPEQKRLLETMGPKHQNAPTRTPGADARAGAESTPAQPERDVELEHARRDAEMNALRNANFDKGNYGLGEFARDNGAALLATILDIGFNKGRGLGAIVGTTANEVGKQEAGRLARAKDAAAAAHQIRSASDDPYKWASLGARREIAGAVQGRYDTSRGDRIDPNSQANQTKRTMAYDTSANRTRGNLDTQHALNERTVGDLSQRAGGQEAARIGARLDLAPQTAQAAANQEREVTGARIGTEAEMAPTSAATAGTISRAREQGSVEGARAGQASNRPLQPGFTEVDPALRASFLSNPEARDKMEGDLFAVRQLGEASRKIAGLRAQYGPNLLQNEHTGEYDALRAAVIGATNRTIAQGGVLNEGERAYLSQLIPGSTPNWKDLAGWLSGNDINAQQLEGFAKGLESVANSRLAGYGIRYTGEQAPQAAAPVPGGSAPVPGTVPPGVGMPGYGHDLSTEGLGPPRKLPARPSARRPAGPAAPAGNDGMVTVSLPGEQPKRVPRALADRMKQMDPTLQVGP